MIEAKKLYVSLIPKHLPKKSMFQYRVVIILGRSAATTQTGVYKKEGDAYEDAMRIQAGLLT